MKKIKILLFVSISLLFSISIVFGATSPLVLLSTGSSAQVQGMAGAGVGIAGLDDSFYNPASIGSAEYQLIKGGYHTGIAGMNSYAGNLLYPLKGKGVVSVGLQYWSLLKGLKVYDETGTLTGESIDANNMFVVAGYGYKMNKISLGLNGKYMSEAIGEKYTGFAVDAGVQYFAGNGIIIGVMTKNVGSKIAGDSLPMNIMAGLSYKKELGVKSTIREILISGQFQYFLSGDNTYQIGSEIQFKHIKAQQYFVIPYARIGISPKSDLGGSLSMLSVGAGVDWNKIQIDYALNPYSDIDEYHHTISLAYRFGNSEIVEAVKKEVKDKKNEPADKTEQPAPKKEETQEEEF